MAKLVPVTPMRLNGFGDLTQLQPGEGVGLLYGGVGQKYRGVIPQASGTTVIAAGSTMPAVTAGTQLFSQAITLENINSAVEIAVSTMIDTSSTNAIVTLAVFRDSTFLGFMMAASSGNSGTSPTPISLRVVDYPNTTAAVTYSVRIGASAGTWYVSRGVSETLGGATKASWTISEELP